MKKIIVSLFVFLAFCSLVEAKTHVVKTGDTLWQLSYDYYGDSTLWNTIAEVNGITNPKTILSGFVLQIPDKETMKKIQNETDPNKKQSLINQATGGSSNTNTNTNSNSNTNSSSNMNKVVQYTKPSESDTRFENVINKEINEKDMIIVPNKLLETESNY